MKIVLISTDDLRGGAARAAYRLQQGLRQIGQECQMLVRYKRSPDENVVSIVDPHILEKSAEALLLEGAIQQHYIDAHRTDISNSSFTLPYPGFDLTGLPQIQEADVINLHWVAHLQSPPTLRNLLSLHKPIVWTLHDEWPFTGGCHYSAGCEGYRHDCAACPQLADDVYELPSAVLQDKLAYFQDAHMTVVTPSRWLAERAAESKLFGAQRIEVIPNSVNTDVYLPIPKAEAKHRLGIGAEVATLLFGAQDGREKRKGFAVLLEALQACLGDERIQKLAANGRLKVLSLGRTAPDLATLSLPIHSLGYTDSDEEICLAYSAADVFVLPSLEDNLPNTMLEAMSCGTPVIGSRVGGIPELVIDGLTGFLVAPGEVRQLAEALLTAILDPTRLSGMSQRCRQVIEQGYALPTQATRYLALYSDLCKTATHEARISPRGIKHSHESMARLEPELGAHFSAIFDSILLTALRDFTFTAYRQWQTSEADRAARLTVIEEQGRQLGEIEAERNDLRYQLADLQQHLEAAEADRTARLTVIEKQGQQLGQVEAERNDLRFQLTDLQRHFEAAEADRAARLTVIEEQGQQLSQVEAERNDLRFQLIDLQRHFEAAEADRAARLTVIEEQGQQLSQVEAERNDLRFQLTDLQRHFEAAEADRAARLTVIEEQGQRLGQVEAERTRLQTQLSNARNSLQQIQQQLAENEEIRSNQVSLIEAQEDQLRMSLAQLRKLQELFRTIQSGRVYKLVRRLGGWKWFEQKLNPPPQTANSQPAVETSDKIAMAETAQPMSITDPALIAYQAAIDAFNATQPNQELLDGIRAYNHLQIDNLNSIRSLKRNLILDIGASPHGYALERALELGVTLYVGIGLDVTAAQCVRVDSGSTGLLFNMDATALQFPAEIFDIVISLSTFEHVLDVSTTLSEIARVLRPDGIALISFEPIWSCSLGHHLHHLGHCAQTVPPWAHLIWSANEMRQFLTGRWPPDAPISIDQAIEWIYEGHDINRLTVRQLRTDFANSPLQIEWIVDMKEENIDLAAAQAASEATGLTIEELITRGLSVLLKKEARPQGTRIGID